MHVSHRYGQGPLLFDSLRFQTALEEEYSITRLSYLLSGFRLEKEDGTLVKIDHTAFIDAKRRERFSLTNIPRGKYRALHFNLGLEKEVNHGDPATHPAGHALNPLINKLHWDWEGGYIFMALEGRFRKKGAQDLSGFVYHLARDINKTRISLQQPMDLRDNGRLHTSLDLQALLTTPQPISFSRDGHSTHSNKGDPLPDMLKENFRSALHPITFENTSSLNAERARLKPLYIPPIYTPYKFTIPRGFPLPSLPLDNPLIVERVNLGKQLFHEKALSQNGSISCASCHSKEEAFSDPRPFSIGLNGEKTPRHSMPLFNLAWKDSFFWDGRAKTLRDQVLIPIEDPIEMHENLSSLPEKLRKLPAYPTLFQNAFKAPLGKEKITAEKIALALEAHLLTLTSTDSKLDRAISGKVKLNALEQRGLELFFMEYEPAHGKKGADCFHCHGGKLFTDHGFHDNGLNDLDDLGLGQVTGKPSDDGKFSTPSLRNIALTAPYMHDGRFNTLEEVVSHYNSGIIRTKNLDPNLAKHPAGGLGLNKKDQAALVAFLKTLSDPQFRK